MFGHNLTTCPTGPAHAGKTPPAADIGPLFDLCLATGPSGPSSRADPAHDPVLPISASSLSRPSLCVPTHSRRRWAAEGPGDEEARELALCAHACEPGVNKVLTRFKSSLSVGKTWGNEQPRELAQCWQQGDASRAARCKSGVKQCVNSSERRRAAGQTVFDSQSNRNTDLTSGQT
jgi:hypothetical protein